MASDKPKYRVMQVILDLELAGAQEVVHILAKYLQRNHCEVVVCAFQDGPMRQKIEDLGVPVELLSRPQHSIVNLPIFLWEMWQIRQKLLALVATYQVDIIQTHLLEVLDFVCLSLRGHHQVKLVLWTVHNIEMLPTYPGVLLSAKRVVYRWLYRYLAHKVDHFIAVSDEVNRAIVREMGSQVASQVETISNGVDTELFGSLNSQSAIREALDLSDESPLILTIGRLTEQKGQRFLIEAAAQVLSNNPHVHFLFVGQGELKERLIHQAKQTGFEKNFHFLGLRKDIPELLATADLFVLPSLWEGLSIALLEALAAAKPVIATAVSGTQQLITSDINGIVVPPSDSTALAQAILSLLDDPDKAQSLGQAARAHIIENYSAKKQVEQSITLYNRLMPQLSP